jgi:hypothetical protein
MNDDGKRDFLFLIEICFVCKESPEIRDPAHAVNVRVTLVIQNSNYKTAVRVCLLKLIPLKWATFMQ